MFLAEIHIIKLPHMKVILQAYVKKNTLRCNKGLCIFMYVTIGMKALIEHSYISDRSVNTNIFISRI